MRDLLIVSHAELCSWLLSYGSFCCWPGAAPLVAAQIQLCQRLFWLSSVTVANVLIRGYLPNVYMFYYFTNLYC